MRSDVKSSRPSEKSLHVSYLRDFRVEQCPLFQQHKCNQHRPYTCFHWHFKNQKRRRPTVRADGNFNYSPDEYCGKYDESSGECPDGDECLLLHRTAGDTERRYHLRYYKTGMCVHETDSRGYCLKNGVHCAFAHGPDDVRAPLFDRKEQEELDNPEPSEFSFAVPNSLDKERNMLSEDPKWQDCHYVLANYKTEPCRKPPRLCRQGYACPHFHNPKDKRRSPKKYKYRSTPCPNVKQGDEWGDPSNCEHGVGCQYCHTRTEQQFHPEIYKSTRCNDIQQSGYCPRAAFCAFAHVEQEMVVARDIGVAPGLTNLADIVSSALPQDELKSESAAPSEADMALPPGRRNGRNSLSDLNQAPGQSLLAAGGGASSAAQRGVKSRTLSGPPTASSTAPDLLAFHPFAATAAPGYAKAPGSERADKDTQTLRRRLLEIDLDPDLDPMEKLRRKNGLFASMGAPLSSSMPAGGADALLMLGHMSLDDVDDEDDGGVMARIDRQTELEERQMALSAPVNIPRSAAGLVDCLTGFSPPQPSAGSPRHLLQPRIPAAVYSPAALIEYTGSSGQPGFLQQQQQAAHIANTSVAEVQRLRDELLQNRLKLGQWEERLAQARAACEAWRLEAEQCKRQALRAERSADERQHQLDLYRCELHVLQSAGGDLDRLPVSALSSLRLQLVADVERLDQAIMTQTMRHSVTNNGSAVINNAATAQTSWLP